MRYLFFDTETNGLPNYKAVVNDESQPHIIQLAAMLCDETGEVKGEFSYLIRPKGWTIPEGAGSVHGITTEDCKQFGISINMALITFLDLYENCDYLVAHNIDFDLRMLRRYQATGAADPFDNPFTTNFCTKQASLNICKLPLTESQLAARKRHENTGWAPPNGWEDYKAPTLAEAYRHFFGRDFDGAHDAMADVRACRDVFFKIRETVGRDKIEQEALF